MAQNRVGGRDVLPWPDRPHEGLIMYDVGYVNGGDQASGVFSGLDRVRFGCLVDRHFPDRHVDLNGIAASQCDMDDDTLRGWFHPPCEDRPKLMRGDRRHSSPEHL